MDDPSADSATSSNGARPHFNRKGQLLGEKGLRTRAGIISETLAMLAASPLPDVTMAAVTKRVGIDAAAFYRYFADIGEVLLAALEQVNAEASELRPLLQSDWRPDEARPRTLVFVDAYHELWKRHAPLLRARNSLSDAGDARFLESRMDLARGLTDDLARKLDSPAPQREDHVTAFGMASLLIMAVERASTLSAHRVYGAGPLWPDLRLGLADMITAAIASAGAASGE